jgi:hypothetical protein
MEEPGQLQHQSRTQGNRALAVQRQYMDDSLQNPYILSLSAEMWALLRLPEKKERSTVSEISQRYGTYIGTGMVMTVRNLTPSRIYDVLLVAGRLT